MVLPHIYHNAKDEQEIRRWATQIQQKLQVLIDAESRNNGIEIMLALEAVFRTSHPNAKSGLLEPNLTAEQEDDPIEGSLGLQGVNDRHIINDHDASIVWNAMRNGNISKGRRALSSNGLGNVSCKTVREQIASKYPRDPARVVPNPARDSCSIDFDDEEIAQRVKKYIFSFRRGDSNSAHGWSMDFLQDLLFYSPNSLSGILVMNKLILNGNLSAAVRKLFFRGREVPLLGP